MEFEKMLSRLGVSRESIREEEEIIETPDEKTVITYDVQVNPQTGATKKVTKFSTTQRQCDICHNYVSKVFECEWKCGAFVCANDRIRSPYGDLLVCRSCYESDKAIHDRGFGREQADLKGLGAAFG
jgi:hypothetical protein